MSENFQMSYLLKVNIAVDQGIKIKTTLNSTSFCFVLMQFFFYLKVALPFHMLEWFVGIFWFRLVVLDPILHQEVKLELSK